MTKRYAALVVGAGIGGIRAALDLAVSGHKVALIDRRPSHGGILAQLDHQFPTDHCGMCKMLPLMARDASSQFCLRKGLFHDNIDLLLGTELASLSGEPGAFKAVVKRTSPLVDPTRCVSCGLCAEACPVRAPSEFDAGLGLRPAVHLPVPHAVPNHYVVDLEACARCWACAEACPTGAIDFKLEGRADFPVLVADADPGLRQGLRETLEAQGFPARLCATGQEAVDAVQQEPLPRLVLMGLNLPDMDGERLLSRIMELAPGQPQGLPVVILYRGKDDEADQAANLVMLGAAEHIPAPLPARPGRESTSQEFTAWLDKRYIRQVSDTVEELDVGAVVLACGFDCYDPAADPYGAADIWLYEHPAVLTALEFERLISPLGPQAGPQGVRLARPGDGRPVSRMAWIQCVGSRDRKKNADFCSGVCCLFAIKEAVLAKERAAREGRELEATVFYMDLRTPGRDYQAYKDRAEREHGVRFIAARPHSLAPSQEGGVVLEYHLRGELLREEVDMVVLSQGARPPKGMERLAGAADIETNEWGFCATQPYAPERTSRVGVFAAGAFGEPKDIAASVTTASAAAQAASRIIKAYDVLAGFQPPQEPDYPDVSHQPARTFVALCDSCPTLGQALDVEDLARGLAVRHGVCRVERVGRLCTAEGWKALRLAAADHGPNRVLLGACMPYAYIPKLKELGRALGVPPALMDVVDVHSPALARYGGDGEDPAARLAQAHAALAMGLARLEAADPPSMPLMRRPSQRALVVGGGVAGMTAATAIADQGYGVVLVEEAEELGGWALRLHTQLDGADPAAFTADLAAQVERHPNITVMKESRVVLSRGRVGDFRSVVAGPGGVYPVEHGVAVLATGGREMKVYDKGLCVHNTVMTHFQMEERLASGGIDARGLSAVAMVQCFRSRDGERPYCSKVCCPEMLKNALTLKERNPDLAVYVFYRDVMAPGFLETHYTRARRAGVVFIRYEPEDPPRVSFEDGRPVIRALDQVLGRELEVRPDLLSLSSGVEPNEVEDLAEVFGVPQDGNGFFLEADVKWRPVDFLRQGVFVCGMAKGPARMAEAVCQAKAAASRALRILSAPAIPRETVTARVRHGLCSRCQVCVPACPYGARVFNSEEERIEVDEVLCQGCGACAAVCPNSATVLSGFTDGSVMAVIDAALTPPPACSHITAQGDAS